jgi:hypothetical protein
VTQIPTINIIELIEKNPIISSEVILSVVATETETTYVRERI